MADALIKHKLHRHPGIGTGQDRGERLLLLGCFGLEDRQVLIEGLELSADITLVAVCQRLERLLRR